MLPISVSYDWSFGSLKDTDTASTHLTFPCRDLILHSVGGEHKQWPVRFTAVASH
jgi:hypothetical protein